LRTWGKIFEPSMDVKAGTWEIKSGRGLVLDCQCYVGVTKTSVHQAFFPFNSRLPPSLNSLPFRSDPPRRRSEKGW
jgi:hypothetical protein